MSVSLAVLLAVIVLSLLSMVLYAAVRKGPDADAQSKNAQFLGGAGDFILHWFLWVVTPLATLSIKLGITADHYNFLGLGLGAASGVLIALGHLELGGWALILSGVCDILDGRVSRATGATNQYGAFIDAVLDRFIELFLFVGFAHFLKGFPFGAVVAAGVLGSSFLVSYARAVGESLNVNCTGGLMQRGERLALVCLALLADRPVAAWMGWPLGTLCFWTLALIAVASFLTAVHRTVWIAGRLRAPSAG